MKRLLINDLINWKNSAGRKPLILNGARQVGKTWLLQEFGKTEYKSVAYINCEKMQDLDAVFIDFNIERIIRSLSAYTNVDILPKKTLIIMDEIQAYPKALTALKYFCEDAPDYHVVVAGSLLGISLHNDVSYPVGKVDELRLYPMNFEEFLYAVGKDKAAVLLKSNDWESIAPLHAMYVDLLRQYYFVGGMPAVVHSYITKGSLIEVRRLQNQILSDYSNDFSKHINNKEVAKLRLVWDSIPKQLAKENKKFQYSELKKGGRAAEFEVAIQWLLDAGLVHKVVRVSEPRMPLRFYQETSVFKLFMSDVGLLGAMIDAPAAQVLIGNNAFVEYKGAFTEQFVCNQLISSNRTLNYYTTNDSQLEVDFLLQSESQVIPIEVKAEENVRSKSLRTFLNKFVNMHAIRFSMRPYNQQQDIINYPLYSVANVPL